MQDIKKLLKEDQENISLFKKSDVSIEEFKMQAEKISEKFFEVYKKYGFPHKDENAEDIYKGAIILTLHQTLENLETIFNDIKNLPAEKVDQKDLAFMIDKIRVIKREKQVYGTQYKVINGKIEFLPIENPDDVNQKRQAIGLDSIDEYKKKAKSNL